jgi:hypothetical protein
MEKEGTIKAQAGTTIAPVRRFISTDRNISSPMYTMVKTIVILRACGDTVYIS